MTPDGDLPAVSVVVASQGRPQALARCVLGLSQQAYPRFEVVAAADAAGLAALDPWGGRLKRVPVAVPNLSAVRNGGLRAAAGKVVAFIDDDAVPEPLWLHHLAAAFADETVAAAGGFVRGPDGLSLQWGTREVGRDAAERPLAVDPRTVTTVAPREGWATRTQGTNMGVRADVLRALGGFDEGFRFWLDETDLNWRLARAGHATAVAPLAEVHHGWLPSARRRAEGLPLSLHEVGASLAVWARRRGLGAAEAAACLRREREERRRGLLRRMVAGRAEPGDVFRLLGTLDEGWAEGTARDLPPLRPFDEAAPPFLPLRADPPRRGHRVLWAPRAGAALSRARALVAEGWAVTLLGLAASARRHRVRFDDGGVWVQEGGAWGPSDAADPPLRTWARDARARREAGRVAAVRGPADGLERAP